MNLEVRETTNGNTLFCCCDEDNTCNEDKSAASLRNCENDCDTYIIASLDECDLPKQCSISTEYGAVYDSYSESSYGFIFSFNFDGIPSEVSRHINAVTVVYVCITRTM